MSPGPVAVVGVGLMGGSLGLALAGRAGASEVRGVDPDPEALRVALAVGAITRAAATVEEAAEGADAVFLATPVPLLPEMARRAVAASGDSCVVTDLGSAKSELLASLAGAPRERFIGGHPVCGAERSGVAFARQELFQGATWFLTPGPEARPELFERLHGLVGALGARPVAIDAEVHDRLMALVSHMPHLLAGALVNQAAGTAPEGREALRSAGPSFADLTRVAGSSPHLWADILLANRAAVADALGAYGARLAEAREAIRRDDRGWLLGFLGDAAGARSRMRAEEAPSPAEAARVVVALPDRPGAISEIATALGHAHINIEDLQLRPGPPGGEGELELVVHGDRSAREAARLVAARGYRVRPA